MVWLAALKHGFSNILRFSGRDDRGTFWPYAGTVVGGLVAAWMIVALIEMTATFERMRQFAEENPEQATITRAPGSYSIAVDGNQPGLGPDVFSFTAPLVAVVCIIVLLLAAAVVRRLHDRNKTGLWGLLPLPFLVFGFVGFALVRESFGGSGEPDMTMFLGLFINNLIYLGSLAFLVARLAKRGSPGENRFGPRPTGRIEDDLS